MHRLGGGFADEIPERDIDGAHRPHRGAPASDEHRIAVHIGPDRLAGHWVRPQNVVPKELSDKLGHETPGPVTGVAEAVSLEAIRCADTYQRVLALIHPSGCEGQRFAQGDGNRPRLHGRNLLSLFGPRGFYRCSRVPIHDMTLPEPASTSLPAADTETLAIAPLHSKRRGSSAGSTWVALGSKLAGALPDLRASRVRACGHINHTTVGIKRRGTEARVLPNLSCWIPGDSFPGKAASVPIPLRRPWSNICRYGVFRWSVPRECPTNVDRLSGMSAFGRSPRGRRSSRRTRFRSRFGLAGALAATLTVPWLGWAKSLDVTEAELAPLRWRLIGPAHMSGRVTDIAVPRKESYTVYCATATGGVWKTINNGTTWLPIFDEQGSSSIGAVAVSDSDPNVVWVGTGEANASSYSSWG